MQVAISRWRVSVSSNQEPFLFNRQLISADNIYYQLINSTVYQTKAQQSPLSIIYMNYGFKKEKKLSILWDQERKQVKHDDTCLCLIKEQVEALCMLQDDTLCDYYSAYFWVQRSMCYTVTITFSFIIKGGGGETCPRLLHVSCCRVHDVWVFSRRLPPSPWEPVPVRPFLGKEAAKEGLSADMDVSRAH